MHLLRTIYYSIFNSHLIYACEIWGQNQNNLQFTKLTKLQNKALKVINFQSSDSPTGPLYQENKVLKISDFINYKNALFVRNTLKREKPQVFHEMFIMLTQNQSYNISCYISFSSCSASENYSFRTILCKVSSIRDMEQASKNSES